MRVGVVRPYAVLLLPSLHLSITLTFTLTPTPTLTVTLTLTRCCCYPRCTCRVTRYPPHAGALSSSWCMRRGLTLTLSLTLTLT